MQVIGVATIVGVLVVVGTLLEADMAENSSMIGARWTVGDTWVVEYGIKVPSPAMARSATPPPPKITRWRYLVYSEENNVVTITATQIVEDGAGDQYQLTFDKDSLGLRSVIRLVDDRPEIVVDHEGQTPYFGWTQSQPAIFDWPSFAALETAGNFGFTTEAGEDVVQTATTRNDGSIEVVLTAKDPDTPETVRSIQVWRPGAKWWQEAKITVEYADESPPTVIISIAGRQAPAKP